MGKLKRSVCLNDTVTLTMQEECRVRLFQAKDNAGESLAWLTKM
jgi:hypothetical protein